MRQTLARPVDVAGTGLFSRRPVRCRLRPAPAGTGIRFVRVDLPGQPAIDATSAHLAPASDLLHLPDEVARRCTALCATAGVATVEHLLAALAALGISDVLIELDAPEPPIGDGSAQLFVDAILRAGRDPLHEPITPLRPADALQVRDGPGAAISVEPADRIEYVYELDFGPASPIPPQRAVWDGSPEQFIDELAPARTFCLEPEARAMRAMGLFTDLSPRDMLVFGSAGPIENALRFPDEPARHKLLDLIGDLALVARPVCARVVAHRSGHALNHALARALAASGVSPIGPG